MALARDPRARREIPHPAPRARRALRSRPSEPRPGRAARARQDLRRAPARRARPELSRAACRAPRAVHHPRGHAAARPRRLCAAALGPGPARVRGAPAHQGAAHMNSRGKPIGGCALLLCAAALAGCGRSEGGTVSGSLAVRVNSEAISFEQVQSARARQRTLEQLIDERLARQSAVRQGLERSPRVVQAIEAATSEILARAYLDQVAAALARPATPEEVRRYYAAHPELFAQRRIYRLEEIGVARA